MVSRRRADRPPGADAAPAPVQPLCDRARAAARYSLGFGEAEVTPGALVAAAGTQRLHVSIDPDEVGGAHQVVAVLDSPPALATASRARCRWQPRSRGSAAPLRRSSCEPRALRRARCGST